MIAMTYLSLIIRRYTAGKSGAVAVEYALLAAFVAIVAAIGMVLVAPNMQDFFIDTGGAVLDAGSGNFTNDPIPS